MKSVALKAYPRLQIQRAEVKKLRASGRVPATIYGRQAAPQNLEVNSKEFADLLNHAASENLLVDLASDQRLLTILAEDYLLSARVEEGRYLDGWGTPFRVGFDANYDEKVDLPPPHKSALGSIVVLSAGPDKTWGTADDLVF